MLFLVKFLTIGSKYALQTGTQILLFVAEHNLISEIYELTAAEVKPRIIFRGRAAYVHDN